MSFANLPQESPFKPGDTVLAYIRISGGEDQSLESQEAYIVAYCSHFDLNLKYIYQDVASGRSTAGRDGFLQMIADVEASPTPIAKGIIFWKIDRLARDEVDGPYYKALLRKRGYHVEFLQDAAPPEMRHLYEAMQETFAARLLKEISENVKRGQEFVYRMTDANGKPLGLWPRSVPYFFLHEPYDLGIVRKDGSRRIVGRLRPDPKKTPLVKRAFELRAQGYAYRDIEQATGLFGDMITGYQNLHNKYKRLFKNSLYKGQFKDIADFVEPMVSPQLWQAANSRGYKRPARGEAWPKSAAHPRGKTARGYLLPHSIRFCGRCRKFKMVCLTRRRGKETFTLPRAEDYIRRYYICRHKTAHKYAACSLPAIPAIKVEPAIIDHIFSVFLTPEYVANWVEIINSALAQANTDRQSETLEDELVDLVRRRNNLIELAEQSGARAVVEQLTLREAQIQDKEKLLAYIREQRDVKPIAVDSSVVGALLSKMRGTLTAEDMRPKQSLLEQIIEKVYIEHNSATIHYGFPLSSGEQFYYRLPRLQVLNEYTVDY
jgi:DNA invertase Pin-like site-specific DNA recombinase